MADSKTVTCSFQMNREMYNQYKSIVVRNGRNVKEDIIKSEKRGCDIQELKSIIKKHWNS